MKLSTFYLNYFPEILIIILTYFISVQNEYKILLFLISLFTFLLIINFITICYYKNEDSNTKCDSDGICFLIIFFELLIFYLIVLLFKCLGKKGRIIFFHIFSGLISVGALAIVFTKYEEKNDFDYIMIVFYIVYLCFIIFTPIIMFIFNANDNENLNINDKINNDFNVNYSSFIDNQNKDSNINSDNNTNYSNNNSEYNINETPSNSFNCNMNNIIADIQNLNFNEDLPSQEEI